MLEEQPNREGAARNHCHPQRRLPGPMRKLVHSGAILQQFPQNFLCGVVQRLALLAANRVDQLKDGRGPLAGSVTHVGSDLDQQANDLQIELIGECHVS
eukprot:scaffold6348_cov259-Pinguiococcus_pyrenoidosus.AAC.21